MDEETSEDLLGGDLPAFHELGITIRDYFAAQALNGMTSNHRWNEATWEQVVEQAYRAADMMLEIRART